MQRAAHAFAVGVLLFADPALADVQTLRALAQHRGAVRAVTFDPDGKLLATAGDDGTIVVWYADRGQVHQTLVGHAGPVHALSFTSDGGLLVSGGADGIIRLWNSADGRPLPKTLAGHAGPVSVLAHTRHGGVLASAGVDGRVLLWDLATGVTKMRYQDLAPIDALVISPDGKRAVFAGPTNRFAASRGYPIKELDTEKQKVVRTFPGHEGGVVALAIAPELPLVASGGEDHVLIVHSLEDSEVTRRYPGHGGRVQAVAFRSDGKLLASAGADRSIRFWDVPLDKERHVTSGLEADVVSLSFAPNGKFLAAGCANGKVLLLSTDSLRGELAPPEDVAKVRAATELLAKQQAAEAAPLLEAALSMNPGNADAHFHLARAHLDLKRVQEGIAEVKKALGLDPAHPNANFFLGAVSKEGGQLGEAISYITRSLERGPGSALAHTLLAESHKGLGQHALAVRAGLRAADLFPADPGHAYNLACFFSLAGDTERSLAWLERAFQNGFDSFDQLKADGDLDNVRRGPAYQELVARYSGSRTVLASSGSAAAADRYVEQADALRKNDDCKGALPLYDQAIREERSSEKPRGVDLRRWLFWAGHCASSVGKRREAVERFEECRKLADSLNAHDELTKFTESMLGNLYFQLNDHQRAADRFREAIRLHRTEGELDMVAINMRRLSGVFRAWGRFDEALGTLNEALDLLKSSKASDAQIAAGLEETAEVYGAWAQLSRAIETMKEALEHAKRSGEKEREHGILHRLGELEARLGNHDRALDYHEQGLLLAEAGKEARPIALSNNHVAKVYAALGKKSEALEHGRRAVDAARRSGSDASLTTTLLASGWLFDQVGEPREAAKYFEEGVALARKLGDEVKVASGLSLAADHFRTAGGLTAFNRALELYEEALAIRKRRGELPAIAQVLGDIAKTLYAKKEYASAATRLAEAVQILEDLRKTATGEARRDYLSRQIGQYQLLVLLHLHNDDPFNAYRTLELSRAKSLAEMLVVEESDVTVPTIPEIQSLAGEGAILMYAKGDWPAVAIFAFDKHGLTPRVRQTDPLLTTAFGRYERALAQTLDLSPAGKRGLTKKRKSDGGKKREGDRFEDLVHYYRWLLQNPTEQNDKVARDLGKLLHEHLVAPMEDRLKGKRSLLVIPEGVMALIPFETLIDREGRYLAETFDVRYAQSLSVLRIVRDRRYDAPREAMLALGGAKYGSGGETPSRGGSSAAAEGEVVGRIAGQQSLRPVYEAMGYGSWGDLPGTLAEVRALSGIVPGAEIVTGSDVSEARIKALSASGKLARFRILHFATHGLVVPELPEMSALVLSQDGTDAEDGYLRMGEIAKLSLAADFVNLSACETGLGRIYGGEGVVGLTQAFMVAGANALSVSLWQVADESTARFMEETYRLVESRGLDFAAAMAEVKRRFLRGEAGAAWRTPHYWAPFVYYGK